MTHCSKAQTKHCNAPDSPGCPGQEADIRSCPEWALVRAIQSAAGQRYDIRNIIKE